MADTISLKSVSIFSVGRFRFTINSEASFLPGIGSGDLNKDGRDDIAVGGWTMGSGSAQNSPIRLLVLKQDSAGDFILWSGFAGGNTTIKGTWTPLIADLNGDGRGDIAAPGYTDFPVTRVSSAFFMPSGSTHKRVNYADKISAHGANIADINGDGIKDVVTAGYGSNQAGTGTEILGEQYFLGQQGAKPTAIWNTLPNAMSAMGSAVAAGDLNNDGHVDYVVGDGWDLSKPITDDKGRFQRSDILVLKGDEQGMPTGPYAAKITPYFDKLRTKDMIEFSGHPGSGEFSHDIRTHIADFDGDGLKDFAVISVNDSAKHSSSLRLYKNKGDFVFQDVTSKWLPQYKTTWNADYSPQFKDFDGNGTVDIALSANSYDSDSRHGNAVFLNDGSGRMHMALRSEYQTWAAQFEKAAGRDIDDFPHFYPVLNKSGKMNFFVLAEHTTNPETKVGESVYATLKTNIDFNKNFSKNVRAYGSVGNDRLFGWAGNDYFYGRDGNDVLKGGAGKDAFVFNTIPKIGNVDSIRDFKVVDDTILLENAVFTGLGRKTGTLAESFFRIGARAHDSNDRIVYDKNAGALYYDSDGIGATEQILFAKLGKGLKMTHKDFLVI